MACAQCQFLLTSCLASFSPLSSFSSFDSSFFAFSVPVLVLDPVPVDSSEAGASKPTVAWMWFPCVGAEKHWPLFGPQLQSWVELYPNLDVPAECNKAFAWIEANAARRKTAKGMPKFLVNWFNRAVNYRRASSDRRQAERRSEPVNDTPTCPHNPPCDVPGRWDCVRRSQREEYERQAS